MLTEKDTIKCESIFNDERTHRYLCKRVWDKNKPLIAVLMLNPCHADNIVNDATTTYVVNNVASFEAYGGVAIINLYSKLTEKLNFRWNGDDELNHPDNDSYIIKTAMRGLFLSHTRLQRYLWVRSSLKMDSHLMVSFSISIVISPF